MNATRFQVSRSLCTACDVSLTLAGYHVCISLSWPCSAHDRCSFIEENNAYKNEQKTRQRGQKMPPGMPSQELMAYWGIALYLTCIHLAAY